MLLPGATRLDVTMAGRWAEPYPSATWRGTAEAAELLYALVLLRCGRRTEWAKSRHVSPRLDIQFTVHLLRNSGLEAQFFYFLGSGWVQESLASLPSREYRPEIVEHRIVRTGELFQFASVASDPPVLAQTILFPRPDVTLLRAERWRLHRRLLEPLDPPWREILAKGRTGAFEE